MITLLIIAVLTIVFCFVFVLLFGAPYLPTLKPQISGAFELLDLPKGATLLELGSGDGRVLAAAAERGYRAVGIELNPLLVLYSKWRLRQYGSRVEVRWGNFWKTTWPSCDGIFVFLLGKYMADFDKKVAEQGRSLRVVSFAFTIPGKKPAHTEHGLFLYQYAAKK